VSISLKSKAEKNKPEEGGRELAPEAKAPKEDALARVLGTKNYLPQVDLLPPSILAKRALQRLKRWLVIILGLVVVVAIGLYAWAALDARSASDELQQAQSENLRLLQEQAKYAEVPKVLKAIALVENARVVGMGREVEWSGYVARVEKALPKDATLVSMTAEIGSPVAAPPVPGDLLQTQGLGTVTLVHQSPTVPDAAAWLDSLSKIPGFVDPLYSTAVVNDSEGGSYYTVTTTVQLTQEALSGRFLPTEDAK